MKVLQVGKFYAPYKGGMETMLRVLSEGLVRESIDVTVLCASHLGPPSEETIDGVKVYRVRSLGSLFSQPICPSFGYWIQKLARDHDIVHVHTPNPMAEAWALTLSKKNRIFDHYHSDVVRQKLAFPVYKKLIGNFLTRCQGIGVGSQPQIDHSPVLKAFESKCSVIPLGVDERLYESVPGTEVDRIRAEKGAFGLFIGRLVTYKGVEYLIKALNIYKGPIVVIGDGPLKNSLQDLAKEVGVQDRVSWLGEVDDVIPYLHACEFLVLPSITRAEQFGMVLVEAMACGKPIVSTKLTTGVQWVNQDGVTGIVVPPKDPEALAAAMTEIHSKAEVREQMAKAARARFSSEFTSGKMVQRYLNVFNQSADRTPG